MTQTRMGLNLVVRAITTINNKCLRQTRKVKVRPFPESGMVKMKEWFIKETFEKVYKAESSHEKAEIFQNILIQKLDEIFPEKVRNINSTDSPWITFKRKKWIENEVKI